MSQALVIACIGYMMCFVVLGTIWAVLALMKNLMVPSEKKPVAPAPVAKKPAPVVQPVAVNNSDDDELIAVLAAAVAASLNTSVNGFKIKSFRRLPNGVSNWGMAAVNDNLANKLN